LRDIASSCEETHGARRPRSRYRVRRPSTALVYSRADAKRLDHIRAHPQIALHLDGDGQGGDIVVLTGEAEIDPDEPPAHKNAPYIAKYGELIRSGWPTAEEFASIYSVPIRIRARRVRGH